MKHKKAILLTAAFLMGAASVMYFGLHAARNHFWKKVGPEVRPTQQYYATRPTEPFMEKPELKWKRGRLLDQQGFTYWEVENMTDSKVKIVNDFDSDTISKKRPKAKRGKTAKLQRKNSLAFTIKAGGQSKEFTDIDQHFVRIIDVNPIEIETYDKWPETE